MRATGGEVVAVTRCCHAPALRTAEAEKIRPNRYAQNKIVSATPIAPYRSDLESRRWLIQYTVVKWSSWTPMPTRTAPGSKSLRPVPSARGKNRSDNRSHTDNGTTMNRISPTSPAAKERSRSHRTHWNRANEPVTTARKTRTGLASLRGGGGGNCHARVWTMAS